MTTKTSESQREMNLWKDCRLGTKPPESGPCLLGNPACTLTPEEHVERAKRRAAEGFR